MEFPSSFYIYSWKSLTLLGLKLVTLGINSHLRLSTISLMLQPSAHSALTSSPSPASSTHSEAQSPPSDWCLVTYKVPESNQLVLSNLMSSSYLNFVEFLVNFEMFVVVGVLLIIETQPIMRVVNVSYNLRTNILF